MPAIPLLDFVQSKDEGTRTLVQMFVTGSELMKFMSIKRSSSLVDKSLLETKPGSTTVRPVNVPWPSTTNAIKTPVDERLIIEGARVEVDEVLDDLSGGTLLSDEIANRARTLGRSMDKRILRGDGANGADDLIGLRDRCNQEGINHVIVAANGGVLTLDDWYAGRDLVEDQGAGVYWVASPAVNRQLRRAVVEEAGGATIAEVAGQMPQLEGVNIVTIRHGDDGTPMLPFDETTGSSNVTTSGYFIAPGSGETNTGGVRLLVAETPGKIVNEGSTKGMKAASIYGVFGLSMVSPRSAVRVSGILAA